MRISDWSSDVCSSDLNGEAATIIGVMPVGFAFPFYGEVFVPRRLQAGEGEDIEIVARLKAGVEVSQARAELDAVAQTLGRTLSGQQDDRSMVLKPLTDRKSKRMNSSH